MTEQTTELATPANRAELTDSKNLAFTAVAREAAALAKSDLVPQAYRDKPANVMVAMELANRIGASVMSVMQSLYIVHGKPSFSSSFLIATVNACGRFTPLRFTFDGEGEDYGCTARATDKSTGEECVGIKVTRRMAKDEGWSTRSGSKWKTLEQLMMTYRTAAFWVRVYAPELSLGIHTVDEIEDITPVRAVATVEPHATPRTRPAALDAVAATVHAPPLPEDEHSAPQDAPAGDSDGGAI